MKVGIVGFGNVGATVTRRLIEGALPATSVFGITSRDVNRARLRAADIIPMPKVLNLGELVSGSEVIIECATAEAFPEIARAVLSRGKTLIAVSACGILNFPDIEEFAHRHEGKVIVASGALPGLDILRSARESRVDSVCLTTRLRPDSILNEPYFTENNGGVSPSTEKPSIVFEGTAGEAARNFPRHFNVAVSLSLAGIGLDRTAVQVWCDPEIRGTIHEVTVEGEDVALTLISKNVPSATNPKTSRIVASSILAALRREISTMRVGG